MGDVRVVRHTGTNTVDQTRIGSDQAIPTGTMVRFAQYTDRLGKLAVWRCFLTVEFFVYPLDTRSLTPESYQVHKKPTSSGSLTPRLIGWQQRVKNSIIFEQAVIILRKANPIFCFCQTLLANFEHDSALYSRILLLIG